MRINTNKIQKKFPTIERYIKIIFNLSTVRRVAFVVALGLAATPGWLVCLTITD
jgi:hypothetical protein